jgi:hypothetical protein
MSKPYKIASKIEIEIDKFEHPKEIDKFELMMDTLSSIVQNYIYEK